MTCCNSYYCKNKINSSYIKWLIELLGPVLIGSKPSEIISIPAHDVNKDNKFEEINKYFSKCKKIDFISIDKNNKGLKILFINKYSLEKHLKCKKSQNFLKFLGYPEKVSADSYIKHLVKKLEGDTFPDEIGVFLGYPIKDVVGFMGYGKNACYNTKYWRVYGDPKPSEELYTKFLFHREKMRELLTNRGIDRVINLF
ncbi:DUF3793 family protein [Romboutsia weinsteinii]|uniref:DUF3793 family protein n=1 Tax=Romboutsia weinsteinii TaxID=2020949 RepID=A0A371J4C9_9FIRM|nr:DUF3793 family protein [Romboutsia weinsteinii]RDY27548.1 DUF3793 family protein [Romboutsia weinsteinii]